MATLADVNNTLQSQNATLEKTQDGIQHVASAVSNQFKFFVNQERDLDKLEQEREKKDGQPVKSGMLSGIGTELKNTGSSISDFLRGLIPGIGAFFGVLGTSFLTAAIKFAKTLFKGALAFAAWPYVYAFVEDKIAPQVTEFLKEVFESLTGIEITDEQKKITFDVLNDSIRTAIIGALFGGVRRGLIAGVIRGAITAAVSLFPSLPETVTDSEAMGWLAANFPGIYGYIMDNPDLTLDALAIGLAFVAPAIVKLGFGIVRAGLPLVFTAIFTKLGAILGVLGLGAFTFKYYTDDEFKSMVDEALRPAREAFQNFVKGIETKILESIEGFATRMRRLLTGVTAEDVAAVAPEVAQIDAQIANLEAEWKSLPPGPVGKGRLNMDPNSRSYQINEEIKRLRNQKAALEEGAVEARGGTNWQDQMLRAFMYPLEPFGFPVPDDAPGKSIPTIPGLLGSQLEKLVPSNRQTLDFLSKSASSASSEDYPGGGLRLGPRADMMVDGSTNTFVDSRQTNNMSLPGYTPAYDPFIDGLAEKYIRRRY